MARSQTRIVLSADLLVHSCVCVSKRATVFSGVWKIGNEKWERGKEMKKKAVTHPDKTNRPSGDTSALSTHEVCPLRVATAPEPGLPEGEDLTSCMIRRLSSDAEINSYFEVMVADSSVKTERKVVR